MSQYHLSGIVSTAFFFLCLYGSWIQFRLILERKRTPDTSELTGGSPTALLSLNQFCMGFIAYYSMFLYGFCLEQFNHYLVWSRLVALLIFGAIFYQIMLDRQTRESRFAFFVSVVLTALGLLLIPLAPQIPASGKVFSQTLVVFISVLLMQGYAHQIWIIRKNGATGAVAIRMHQLILAKDVATILFGLAMGLQSGWPVILLMGSSAITKITILWHFRWVRTSDLARQRRAELREITLAVGE